MALLRVPITAAIFHFADDLILGRLPQFPLASSVHRRRSPLTDDLRVQAEKLSDNLPPLEIHRRQVAAEVRAERVVVPIEPRHSNYQWREAVELNIDAFIWEAEDLLYASLPLLKICVIGSDEEELLERIKSQVQFVLGRQKSVSLDSLLLLPQPEKAECERLELSLDVKSPKEIYRSANQSQSVHVLKDIGENLGTRRLRQAYGRQTQVRQIAELLGGDRPTSVLLVGDSGVGKTAIVHELIRQRDKFSLRFRQYWQTSGTQIVAGMCGFGAWQQRCEDLRREVAEKEALLHLGNLFELMEVGQHESSELGIGDYLRPAIESGKFPCLAECTSQQLDEIQRRSPRMLDAFEHIAIQDTSPDVTTEVLVKLAKEKLPAGEPVPDAAIEETLHLHQRFAVYSARPGRIVRFFGYLLEDWKSKQPINGEPTTTLDAESAVESFSQQTGLPRAMLDDRVPLDLDEAETWFNSRVIGQRTAVSRVLDALASVKTNLTRPGRPIASFLMIGPTGVGKTELAKTLTEFLYKNPDRMTRIDMSEYADPLGAARLAGSSWQEEGILTSKVREQPFGVVLLDEFEKAHSDVFDLLLQILGEGRLTDPVGRIADFSTTVILMTSNLGAETAGRAESGFQTDDQPTQRIADHYLKEVQRFLRPEIYNRIDRIIPFSPLDRETVAQIVVNELNKVKQRVSERAGGSTLDVAPEVIELIAEKGYEPTLGARPIRRQIDRLVVGPVAAKLNEEQAKRGGVLQLTASGDQVRVRFRSPEASDALQANQQAELEKLANRAMGVRRQAVLLGKNYVVEDLRNERNRLRRQKLRLEAKKKSVETRLVQRLHQLENEIHSIETLVNDAREFEQQTLLSYYQQQELDDVDTMVARTKELEEFNNETLLWLYGKSCEQQSLTLMVFGNDADFVLQVADSYAELCRLWKMHHKRFDIILRRGCNDMVPAGANVLASKAIFNSLAELENPDDLSKHPSIEFLSVESDHETAEKYRKHRFGIVLEITDVLAVARFQDEGGKVRSITSGFSRTAMLEIFNNSLKDYEPMPLSKFQHTLREAKPRRTINHDKLVMSDELMSEDIRFKRTDTLTELLRQAVEENLVKRAIVWSMGG